jgi:hypothetical protein
MSYCQPSWLLSWTPANLLTFCDTSSRTLGATTICGTAATISASANGPLSAFGLVNAVSKSMISLQLLVTPVASFKDGDAGVGVFPEGE